MTIEQLRKAHNARPFRSFTIRTGGGREYRVPHPEFMWIHPAGRTFGIADPDGSIELLDLLLVESLHYNDARRSNGRRRS